MGLTNKELSIKMTMRDMATKELTRAQGRIKKFSRKAKQGFVSLAAKVYLAEKAFHALSAAVSKTAIPLIQVGSKVEDLKIRLNVLFKSTEKGNQVFKDMSTLAGNVPKTYDEIMESATNLAGVVKGGTDEINKLMPMIVDISSATGLSVEETTSQMIRMYSSGIASADMFRERGISAALGFKSGISYTNQETMDILYKQWEEGFGKYVGASEQLATTFTGMSSMMQDAWFQFKQGIGEPMFESIKVDMQAVLKLIEASKKEGGEYSGVIKDMGESFQEAYDSAKNLFAVALIGGGQVIDIFNEIVFASKGAQAAWVGMISGIMSGASWLGNIPGIGSRIVDKEALEAGVDAAIEGLHRLNTEIKEARERADVDYSENIEQRIQAFKESLDQEKEALIEHQEDLGRIVIEGDKQIAQREKIIELTDLQKEKYKELGAVNKQIEKAFSRNLAGMMTGAKTAKEAFQGLGDVLVNMIANYLAEWIIAKTVGQALEKTAVALAVTDAVILAEAWKPAAVFAAVATAGGAAVAGAAGLTAAYMSATGLSAVSKIPGLAEGGIVPATPGGRIIRVAEGGEDEAIVPLGKGGNRVSEYMGESAVIIEEINIYGNVDEGNARDLAEEIGEVVRRERGYIRSL